MTGRTETLEMDEPFRATRIRERILLVERDDRKRGWMRFELERAGWEVISASNPIDAFVAWIRSQGQLDLVIMNPQATNGAGLLLWKRLAFLQRGLRVLLPLLPPEIGEPGRENASAGAALVVEVRRALRSWPREPLT